MAVKIYSFFGPPGSGKGTLAQFSAQKMNFEILSVGNLCRKLIAFNFDLGKEIKRYLDSESLIPDELIVNMVNDWVLSKVDSSNNLILDGFPRNIVQAELFLKFLNKYLPTAEFNVINFELSQDLALNRVLGRLMCLNSSCLYVCTSFNREVDNKVCNFCGAFVEKRKGDDLNILRKRFNKFSIFSQRLLKFYHEANVLVKNLNVENKKATEVFCYFRDKLVHHVKL